jgi:hypothetical protein
MKFIVPFMERSTDLNPPNMERDAIHNTQYIKIVHFIQLIKQRNLKWLFLDEETVLKKTYSPSIEVPLFFPFFWGGGGGGGRS